MRSVVYIIHLKSICKQKYFQWREESLMCCFKVMHLILLGNSFALPKSSAVCPVWKPVINQTALENVLWVCSFRGSVFSKRKKKIFVQLRPCCVVPTTSSLTRHDGLLAFVALGRVLIGVTLSTQQLLVLGGERFVHQRALTLEAVETVLMPVAVFI